MSAPLDAALLVQNYSRPVIDCNRDPAIAASVPSIAEFTPIPGDVNLSAEEVTARGIEIFEPYHCAIRHGEARGQLHVQIEIRDAEQTLSSGAP